MPLGVLRRLVRCVGGRSEQRAVLLIGVGCVGVGASGSSGGGSLVGEVIVGASCAAGQFGLRLLVHYGSR